MMVFWMWQASPMLQSSAMTLLITLTLAPTLQPRRSVGA